MKVLVSEDTVGSEKRKFGIKRVSKSQAIISSWGMRYISFSFIIIIIIIIIIIKLFHLKKIAKLKFPAIAPRQRVASLLFLLWKFFLYQLARF